MAFRDDLLRGAARVVNPKVDKLGRAAGLDLQGRIIKKTPVDTSRARSNWSLSKDRPVFSRMITADGGRFVRADAARTVQNIKLSEGDELWIANGVPYIERLEDGYSGQAPAGMVRVSVQEMAPVIRRLAEVQRRGRR